MPISGASKEGVNKYPFPAGRLIPLFIKWLEIDLKPNISMNGNLSLILLCSQLNSIYDDLTRKAK